MYNTDNIFYLPGNIDIRLCPKNGYTSTKAFFIRLMHILENKDYEKYMVDYNPETRKAPQSWRQLQVWQRGDQFNIPFRRNSVKFAVKRDPFDRFKSCVEMLQLQALSPKIEPQQNVEGMNRDYKYYHSVSKLLDDLEAGNVLNMHFWTQTYYLGDKNQYDYIYDLKDYEEFLKHALSFYNITYRRDLYYFRRNISNNVDEEIVQEEKKLGGSIHYQYDFQRANKKDLITEKMTPHDYARIRKLYKIDFDNGWC